SLRAGCCNRSGPISSSSTGASGNRYARLSPTARCRRYSNARRNRWRCLPNGHAGNWRAGTEETAEGLHMAVASDRPAGDGRENRPGSTLGGSPVPLYHRIYVNLRQRIHSGELANGELLPGEAALAREFGVSQITVWRAL